MLSIKTNDRNRETAIKIFVFSILSTAHLFVHAQEKSMEEAVEKITSYNLEKSENVNNLLWDEDMLIQHWLALYKKPLDLNKADENDIQQQLFLNPLQTQAFMAYRKGVGNLVDIYELQALPGWEADWLRLIVPFVKISGMKNSKDLMNELVEEGNHRFQMRVNRIMQKKLGFQTDSMGYSPFTGSRWSREFRYAYADGRRIKWGFQGASDAGERWAMNKNQIGMDYVGYYISLTPEKKWIRKIVVGDYTVSIGQGLMLWQSFGGYKGNDILMIKNQSKGLQPYQSTGEGIGFRGVGIEANKGKETALIFISSKKTDADLVRDSMGNTWGYRPYQTGLHRTSKELDKRNKMKSQTLGYSISHKEKNINLSFNHVFSLTQQTLISSWHWYDQFEQKGKWQNNIGMDFTAQYFGNHFFGECIMDHNGSKGIWLGVLSSLSKNISMSSFFRKLDRGLMSFSAKLPAEYGGNNEEGVYLGVKMSNRRFVLDAYADVFRSRWLRFGINTSSFGNEWVISGSVKTEDKTEFQFRVKQENKPASTANWQNVGIKPWIMVRKTNVRLSVQREINQKNTIKIRTELVQRAEEGSKILGFGQYYLIDFRKICMKNKCKMNFWLCYTDIPDADLALYTIETDPVLGAAKLTSLYRTGLRMGLAFSLIAHKKLKINVKYTETICPNENFHGMGLERTSGINRSELAIGIIMKQ